MQDECGRWIDAQLLGYVVSPSLTWRYDNVAISAEVGLLSAVIRTGDMEPLWDRDIRSSMFHDYRDEARWLFNSVRKYGTVPSKAKFKHAFPQFRIAAVDDTAAWCDSLLENHAMVSLYSAMDDAATALENGDDPVKATRILATAVTKSLAEVDTNRVTSTQDYSDILAEVQRRSESNGLGESVAWPTGFSTIDAATGGLHPGRLVVIGARLGHGKTWMLQRMAKEVALAGGRALFISLEMTEFEITIRQHALMAPTLGESFNPFDLMQGSVDLSAYEAFLQSMKDHVEGEILISDGSSGSVAASTIGGLVQTYEPDVTFVDYLTLLSMNGRNEDHRAIAEVTRELKQIGHAYHQSIVVAAQLNRDADYGKGNAGPENLARSDAIGQDADLVITLKKLSESVRRGLIAKNRFGREGDHFYVKFKPGDGIIEETTGDNVDDLMDEDAEAEDDS